MRSYCPGLFLHSQSRSYRVACCLWHPAISGNAAYLAGRRATGGNAVTYTTNIRLDDDLADSIKDYARASGGISIADAIRILLAQALKENRNAHASGH